MERSVPKKVLFVITKSNWGGAQKYVFTLATHLSRRGNAVTVAFGGTGEAGAAAGLLAERLKGEHIPVLFLPSFSRDFSLARDVRSFFELLKVLRILRPDILHLNSSKAGGIGSLVGRIAGIKRILFTAHGWAHREARNPLATFAIWLMSWLTIALSHKVIAVSTYDYHHAPVLFSRKKIVVIHNGIQPHELLSHIQARNELEKQIPSLPKNKPLIISIGELTNNKDHALLITSLAQVTTPFFCIIIGEGEERTALEQLIHRYKLQEEVALPGFITNASTLLPAADLFVLPSKKEGLPYTLLEAGLASLPVIATHTGGIPEIIGTQNAGILVPTQDAPALTSAIEKILHDKNLQEQLGRNLNSRITSTFSEEEMLRQTDHLYT